jgi:hypothetical protein
MLILETEAENIPLVEAGIQARYMKHMTSPDKPETVGQDAVLHRPNSRASEHAVSRLG